MIIVTSGFSNKYSFFIFRSSRKQIFFKTGVIKNFAIFTGKYLCGSLFLLVSSQKRLQHRCFPVNIAKFLGIPFLQNTSSGCFCQFDKVTVQRWASVDLLFLIKNKKCGMVSTKKVCRSGQSMLFTHYQQKPFQHAFID